MPRRVTYRKTDKVRGTCVTVYLLVTTPIRAQADATHHRINSQGNLPKSSAESCLRPALLAETPDCVLHTYTGLFTVEEFGLRPRCFRSSLSVDYGQFLRKIATQMPPRLTPWYIPPVIRRQDKYACVRMCFWGTARDGLLPVYHRVDVLVVVPRIRRGLSSRAGWSHQWEKEHEGDV